MESFFPAISAESLNASSAQTVSVLSTLILHPEDRQSPFFPTDFTDVGIIISRIPELLWNAYSPISSKPSFRTAFVSDEQFPNAPSPRLLTLPGTVMEETFTQ